MYVRVIESPSWRQVSDVLLNGKNVKNVCVAAHEEEGWVELYPHEFIDGKLIIKTESGWRNGPNDTREDPKPYREHGKVEIVMDAPTHAH